MTNPLATQTLSPINSAVNQLANAGIKVPADLAQARDAAMRTLRPVPAAGLDYSALLSAKTDDAYQAALRSLSASYAAWKAHQDTGLADTVKQAVTANLSDVLWSHAEDLFTEVQSRSVDALAAFNNVDMSFIRFGEKPTKQELRALFDAEDAITEEAHTLYRAWSALQRGLQLDTNRSDSSYARTVRAWLLGADGDQMHAAADVLHHESLKTDAVKEIAGIMPFAAVTLVGGLVSLRNPLNVPDIQPAVGSTIGTLIPGSE